MKVLGKIFSLLILLFTVYLIAIFFAPSIADSIGQDLWVLSFNTWVRELKWGADTVSEDILQLKDAWDTLSWARSVVDKTKDLIQKTQQWIETTRQTIQTKVDQVNKVADSFEKTKNSVTELQKNIDNLTTFDTGTTNSWNSK